MRYSPGEVQQLLGIPDSTLRRLARQFTGYLSPKQGKNRQYSERDISTLRLAREMLEKGSTVAQIKLELDKIVDLHPDEEAPQETALAPIDRRLSQLAAELEQLRQDRAADRQRIEQLEQQITELSKPWYRKIFKRPPAG